MFGWLLCGCHKETPPEKSTPIAPVAKVTRSNLTINEVIPAEFRAYVAVPLHAKVSGYLDQMNVDFGDIVTNGELLITIEVPELSAQLSNAQANVTRSEADYANAHLIYTRLLTVNKEHPNLVAQQDIDNAFTKDRSTKAEISAAQAEVDRYQTLVSYTRITAPFNGVVTHRYVDPGVLVEAGTSGGSAQPLLEVADNYHLRLDFPVSVGYVKDIHVGDPVTATVESLDGRVVSGKITRATWQVNDDTRTMMTEMEVDNPDLTLVPGMYCSISIPVERRPNTLAVPIEAVPPRQTNDLYVVNSQNEIEKRPVKLGIQTANQCEVISGVQEGESVLLGSRTQFREGEKVESKLMNPAEQ